MPESYSEFDAAEYIETDQDARLHLELCTELDPGDGSVIRAALSTIARARNMSALARETGLDRSSIYDALSEEGNPTLTTFLKITGALGLRLRLEPVERGTEDAQVHHTG